MSEHLRALALAATPEMKTSLRNAAELAMHLPWEKPGDSIPFEHKQTFKDLATPAAILALLDELEDSHKAYALLFKECAELRKNSDRYLWLRKTTNFVTSKGEKIDVRNQPDLWDSSIDAAILAAKGESHAD